METNNQQICSQSRDRTLSCRIELLNNNYNIVDYLEGETIDGNLVLTNDSGNNFSRLSGSLTLLLLKELSQDYFKLDLKHLVRVIMIITDNIKNITAEYNLGITILNSPQIVKGIDGNSKISINLNDLMSNYNGDFNGELDHTVTIKSSTDSSANMSQTLQAIALNSDLMGLSIDKIKFESNTFEVPHDITCEAGNKITDLLKSLIELDMAYELFFDNEGILTYQRIRNYNTDTPIQEFNNSPLITNYDVKNNFTNVRNIVKVLGAIQESADSISDPYQFSGIARLDNPNHPLSTVNIGEKKKVIVNDKGISDEVCQSQAEYNLDQFTNYAQVLELAMLPDYRLLPNRVITVKYEDDDISIDGKYLINNVNFGFKVGDLTTVNCSKLYT